MGTAPSLREAFRRPASAAALAASLCLWAAASAPSPAPGSTETFTLKPPTSPGKPIRIWATWYWTPSYRSSGSAALLDRHEHPLGPRLPDSLFCHAAVQGAVRVDGVAYTYDQLGKRRVADCRKFRADMPHAGYVRFRRARSQYGEGVEGFNLVPYRTVAVDVDAIKVGTVLYIPAARGTRIRLPDGRTVRHDGYFFAGDEGFGIEGKHLDVFNGISDKNPFPWVDAESAHRQKAYIVRDRAIVAALRKEHLAPQ